MRTDSIPSVPRSITNLVVRTMGFSPVEARRWYRQANDELDGRTPEEIACTIEGTQFLVAWLGARELAAAVR